MGVSAALAPSSVGPDAASAGEVDALAVSGVLDREVADASDCDEASALCCVALDESEGEEASVVDDGVALTVMVLAGLLCVLVEQATRARGKAASAASFFMLHTVEPSIVAVGDEEVTVAGASRIAANAPSVVAPTSPIIPP